jgi:phage-related protein (TIGR01555 family)
MKKRNPYQRIAANVKREEISFSSSDAKTKDGMQNFVARLGAGIGSGNALSYGTYTPNLISRNRVLCENIYRGSWIAGKIIDDYAEDMTRAGIDISVSDDPEISDKIYGQFKKLGVWQDLASMIKWARLYGGATAMLNIDGQDTKTPLDISTVGPGQFQGLIVFDRWQLQPDLQNIIQSGRDYGLPMYYQIITPSDAASGGSKATGQIVHHSRMIRMVGIDLPFWQAVTENLWGESVLERLYDRLLSFDSATMGASNLVNRAYLRTVKVDKLREVLAAGGQAESNLLTMFRLVRELQQNEGLTLIDSADEMQFNSYTFAGLSDMLIQFGQQISGACGIPLVRLFGQSPAGMNSTGEADLRTYYDSINSQQVAKMTDGVDKIVSLVYRSELKEDRPSDLTWRFNSLWQMSAKEKIEMAKAGTDAIILAHESGLVDVPTAMKELAQLTELTGMFSNITPELISEAEAMPPMMSELEAQPLTKSE